MPRKSTAAPKPTETVTEDAPVFKLASLREAKRYVWRDIDRLEGRPPLRIKVLDLNIREAETIPVGLRTPLRDALKMCAPYVVDWNLEAEDLTTGKTIPVPAPGSGQAATAITGEGNEWELLELLDDYTANRVILWLKNPAYMAVQEKNSKPSGSGDASPDAATTATSA
jgi:hypothetical protein